MLLFLSIGSSNAQCDPMFDPFCEDVDVPLDDWIPYIVLFSAIATVWLFKIKKNVIQVKQ